MSKTDIWQTLARRGKIVELKIGRPRFEEKLSLSDLGISPRNKAEAASLESQVRAGTKLLLPPDYDRSFKSLESAARHTLHRNTSDPGQGFVFAFDTPFGAFIPVGSFEAWLKRVEGYREDYMNLAKDLLKNYAKVKTEVLRDYAQIANGTWSRLRAYAPEAVKMTQSEFSRVFVHSVREAFPTPDELRWCDDHALHMTQHTYFEWRLREIAIPDAERRALVAEQIATEEEKEHKKTLLQMADMARDSSLKELEGFSAGLNKQLYELLFEISNRAIESITGAEFMPSKTLEQLQNTVAQIKALNVMDNNEVVDWAQQLADEAGAYSKATKRERSEKGATALLESLAIVRDATNVRLEKYGEARRVRRMEEPGRHYRAQETERRQRIVA